MLQILIGPNGQPKSPRNPVPEFGLGTDMDWLRVIQMLEENELRSNERVTGLRIDENGIRIMIERV